MASVWTQAAGNAGMLFFKQEENIGLLQLRGLAAEACRSAAPAAGTPVYLDVATAIGDTALTIAQSLPDATVHATDFNEAMVQKVKDRLSNQFSRVKNVISAQADGTDLKQFDNSSVHAVTCIFGLEFMSDWQRALSEFYRVLKPNGSVFIAVWSTREQHEVARMTTIVANTIAPDFKIPIDPSRLATGDPPGQDVVDALTAAGFTEVQLSGFACEFTAASVDALYAKFVSGSPMSGCIAHAEQAGNSNAATDARALYQKLVEDAGIINQDGTVRSRRNQALVFNGRKA